MSNSSTRVENHCSDKDLRPLVLLVIAALIFLSPFLRKLFDSQFSPAASKEIQENFIWLEKEGGEGLYAVDSSRADLSSFVTVTVVDGNQQSVSGFHHRAAPFFNQPIPVNSADAATLETIPGIGNVLATRIIETRNRKGGFRHINDLLDVKGIGQKKLSKLKQYISVD